MLKDIYGRDLDVGFTVVFTSTPHRGKRPVLRTGRITKIYSSGKVTIKQHTSTDVGTDALIYAVPSGTSTTLHSTGNVIQW